MANYLAVRATVTEGINENQWQADWEAVSYIAYELPSLFSFSDCLAS
ncbi:hypothetical protein [Enterococcus sp. BWR-S5]|nr:hypothetical protein [Enterococcus sp. BWR-S5]MBL1224303.1 hypothetical protein [Enterococcus sp. BWR-S5]